MLISQFRKTAEGGLARMFQAQLEAIHLGQASSSMSQATAFTQTRSPAVPEPPCSGAQPRPASPLPALLRPCRECRPCSMGRETAGALWDPPFPQDPDPHAGTGTPLCSGTRAATGYANIPTNAESLLLGEVGIVVSRLIF